MWRIYWRKLIQALSIRVDYEGHGNLFSVKGVGERERSVGISRDGGVNVDLGIGLSKVN